MTDNLEPPHSIEIEESFLGSILIDPSSIITVSDLVTPEDFYRPKHKDIYESMLDLHKNNIDIDIATICDHLESSGKIANVGGISFVSRLMTVVHNAYHVESYAKLIRNHSRSRQLISAAGKIAKLAYSEEPDALDSAQAILLNVSMATRERDDFILLPDALKKYLEKVEDSSKDRYAETVPTGFFDLDKLLGGLQRSDLIIVGARTSQGKTSLGLSIASNAGITYAKKVAIFSIEMAEEQLVQRFLASESGVDSSHIRDMKFTQEEVSSLSDAYQTIVHSEIYIDDTPDISIMDIRSKLRTLSLTTKLDLVIVDYLQMIKGTRGRNRVEELGEISRGLKAIAKELNVPIIALAQLSRAVENRNPPIPMLSDLRESGNIEQDADVVMFIYREDLHDENSERKNIADIIVAKHRNGPTGKVSLFFRESTASFHELARA